MARISPGAGLALNHKIAFGVISIFTFLFIVSYFISLVTKEGPEPTVESVGNFFAEFEMNFQGNKGSFTDEVKYFSKGYQYDLMFMNNEVLLNLYSTQITPPGTVNSTNNKTRLSQVSLEFLNAAKAPTIKGLSEFVTTKVASSSMQEEHLVESFAEIKYTNLYPGVDVYFSGKQKKLFYEFVLSDTADVNDIALKVNGLDGIGEFEIDMHGNIKVNCHGKHMEIQKPKVFRIANQQKIPVNGYFIVSPDNEIRFKMAGDAKLL